MTSQPLVTIMIPTYNQANWLPAAIESALAQDYPCLEIVVSNDNSTDTSLEVLKNYDNEQKVKIFSNPVNLGRVGNYKYTLENYVTGTWVVNLDGDDYFTDSAFISKAVKYIMSSAAEVAFLQAGHTVKTQDGKTLELSLPHIRHSHEIIDGETYFLNFSHFSHLSTVFHRQKACALDFYRYDILSSDIECFLRLALHGKVILMRETVGVWLHHGQNESKKLSIDVVEKNMLRFEAPYVYAKDRQSIPTHELNRWRRKKLNDYLLNYLAFSFKHPSKLKGYFFHVLKSYPHIFATLIVPKAIFRAIIYRCRNLFFNSN